MKKEVLVSVIVPVYKVENYLERCVDSIINQTYKNLEIVLVDDGSPDKCPQMCDEYAKKDARVKVIHKPNGGLSDARNVGFENSNGTYAMFVDSDDYLELNTVEELYDNLIKTDSDISCGMYAYVYDNDPGPSITENKLTILTPDEIDYIKNDVEIMARALDIMFNEHLDKMTIGSDALSYYKKSLSSFDMYYPNIGIKDELIRKSYRGGWTYLNPLYKDATVGEGLVIDKNSMYPSMMYDEYLPFGDPIYFDGKYEEDKTHPLYIQMFSCSFKTKEGKLPTVQLKHTLGYMDNEYIETTNGRIETLTLTNIDLDLFFEHYDVEYLEYHAGFKFKRIKGLFKSYIDHWMGEKIKAGKEGNGAKRQIAKLMLNSLYR